MGLKGLFKPRVEKYEQRGDDCVRASDWGMAKLAYEAALEALQKKAPHDAESGGRIREKLERSMEALCRRHMETAEELMASGFAHEALEYLELALGLTHDASLRAKITSNLEKAGHSVATAVPEDEMDMVPLSPVDEWEEHEAGDDETFMALLGALPEAIRSAYAAYGPAFRAGYLALNRGDFQVAVEALSRAMAEDPSPDAFIPLELATALLNVGRLDEARGWLESFLEHHPEALPGYQVLCEVFWEMGAFDRAEALLASCPDDLKTSVAYLLLRGEGLSRAGRPSEAAAFYEASIKRYGRNDPLLRALAATYEVLGKLEQARDLYTELMNPCQGCRTRPDPLIKRRLSDVRFALGERGTAVLESYLSLAQEDPGNGGFYFDRISTVYGAMGNDAEARRFAAFARRAEASEKEG